MEFLVDLLIYAIFAVGAYLIQWGIRHKSASLTILAIIVMVVDVFVWLHFLH